MNLNEAKIILNENGYELLDEGKLGRAIGMGALALGSLFSNSFAADFPNLIDDIGTKYQTEEEAKTDLISYFNNEKTMYCKSKYYGVVCKEYNNTNTKYFVLTKKVPGFSKNVIGLGFNINEYNKDLNKKVNVMHVYHKDGNHTTYVVFDNGMCSKTIIDDMGSIISDKIYKDTEMYNKIFNYYNEVMKK